MPTRPSKSTKKKITKTTKGKPLAAKAKSAAGKVKAQRFAAAGRTTRVQAHVSSRGKRNQAKRDSR